MSVFSFLAVSCADDYDDGGYSNVQPGIFIYTMGSTTNSLSLDALSVATRLGVVLEEMKYQDIEVVEGADQDWGELDKFLFPLNNKSYDIKNFLFGGDSSTSISKSGNIFTITYGEPDKSTTFGSGVYDSYRRNGSFTVDTKGVSLVNSTVDNAWEIYIEGEPVKYANNENNVTVAEVKDVNTLLYHVGVGTFNYELHSFKGEFTQDQSIESDWSGNGSFTISNFKSLAINNLLGSDYSLTVSPDTGGMSLNGVEVAYSTGGMTPEVDVAPLVYSPSEYGYGYVSGTEQVMFTGEYNMEYFIANSVSVKWFENSASVTYGDYKYSM